MSFTKLPTKEAAQRMAQASVYIEKIGENDVVSQWYKKNIGKPLKAIELINLLKLVISECYEDASAAISILTGKDKAVIDSQTMQETIDDINELAGGNILRFFSVSSGTAAEK